MATGSMALGPQMSPPPDVGGPTPGAGAPTTPPVAAPAAPKPNPALQRSTQDVLQIVNLARGLAQAYPGAAPHVQRINEEVRQIMRVMMEHQEPGEPAAPPLAG